MKVKVEEVKVGSHQPCACNHCACPPSRPHSPPSNAIAPTSTTSPSPTEPELTPEPELQAVDDNLSGTTKQAMEMLSFFTAPVAGGIKTKFVYYVTMLFCMYLFINSIVTAAPTWAEPITSVELEHAGDSHAGHIHVL